jgi:hypothetical protein
MVKNTTGMSRLGKEKTGGKGITIIFKKTCPKHNSEQVIEMAIEL